MGRRGGHKAKKGKRHRGKRGAGGGREWSEDANVQRLNPEIKHDMSEESSRHCWHMSGMVSSDVNARIKMGRKGLNAQLNKASIDPEVQARFDLTYPKDEEAAETFSKGLLREREGDAEGEGEDTVTPTDMGPYRQWLDDDVIPAPLDKEPKVLQIHQRGLLPVMGESRLLAQRDIKSIYYERQAVCAQLEHLSSKKEGELVIQDKAWLESEVCYDRYEEEDVRKMWFHRLPAHVVDNDSRIRISGRFTFKQEGMEDDRLGRLYVAFGEPGQTLSEYQLPTMGEELGKGDLTFHPADIPLQIQLTALARAKKMGLEERLIPAKGEKMGEAENQIPEEREREREGGDDSVQWDSVETSSQSEAQEHAKLMRDWQSVQITEEQEEDLTLYLPDGLTPNRHQMAAIIHSANTTADDYPYLIFGPPGTGKTTTVVALAAYLLNRDDDARVLLCAPSNTAADVLAECLFSVAPDLKTQTLRVCSGCYERKKASETIKHRIPFDERGNPCKPDTEDMLMYRCIITTSSGVTLIDPGALEGVSHIVVDECGSALEIDTLAAICPVKASIVLAGDPRQLGPVVLNKDCKEVQYGISMLQRLMVDPAMEGHSTMLTENYRNHPAILYPSNTMFYQDRLSSKAGERAKSMEYHSLLPRPGFPLMFTGVKGCAVQSGGNGNQSWKNNAE
ncbi:hypothetical protein KIPB_007488, partial [Kipferlia bialata]|eukprot:g7488.t1